MSEEEIDMENYSQEELFWKESTKEYVPMSDGAELLVYYTKKGGQNKKTILFLPGYATGVFSWSDLWDELHTEYDLYVFESREKNSSKVKWKHKADMNRLGLDVKETIEHFKFDQNNLFMIGSSFGCSTSARAMAEKWFKPAGILYNGPSVKFILPRKILWLAYILPAFVLQVIGIPIIRLWISIMFPKGFQKKHYNDFLGNANAMRWKKTLSTSRWNALEDYAKVPCKTWVTLDPDDSLHTVEFVETILSTIPDSTLVKVPSYNYMHHYPGARNFAKQIKELIESLE